MKSILSIILAVLPLAALMWFWQATVGLVWEDFGNTGGRNDE